MANLNKLNTLDWSDKFIRETETLSNELSGLGKKNMLKYENDTTVDSRLGWSYFETNNESLQDEVDYIALPFSASNDVVIDGNQVAQVSVYNNNGRITDREINKRIFAINGDKLQFTGINWANVAGTYYANYFRSLSRVRVVNCEMNLSKLDVLTWNEKKLIYVEYFKSTFIVLEINNFIPGRVTKVKLLNYGR